VGPRRSRRSRCRNHSSQAPAGCLVGSVTASGCAPQSSTARRVGPSMFLGPRAGRASPQENRSFERGPPCPGLHQRRRRGRTHLAIRSGRRCPGATRLRCTPHSAVAPGEGQPQTRPREPWARLKFHDQFARRTAAPNGIFHSSRRSVARHPSRLSAKRTTYGSSAPHGPNHRPASGLSSGTSRARLATLGAAR